ncbi:MAG: recombination protein RecF [Chitinophagaceae bacterium]|nr:recombination protein RecF [Chitinophagaceae bacterium]
MPVLRFSNLHIIQFRNYQDQQFNFDKRIIGICGPNGTGKTNLLDALYYLCFTKSYFSRPDGLSMKEPAGGFRISGEAIAGEKKGELTCIVRENGRKEFSENNEPYKKFSAHIGKYPCVMIAPDDVQLITGGSEERRNFIDTIISQVNKDYLQDLIDYNKVLLQRNSFLKSASENQHFDEALLSTFDKQLAEKGQYIFSARVKFLDEYIPVVKEQYQLIAGKEEAIALKYDSQLLNAPFTELLIQNRSRDLYLQRTGAGIHKDDAEILLDQQPFKSVASQGQRKTLLFALKLAEYFFIKSHKGFSPLLLLDDVFEKLDAERMENLLTQVCVKEDGQVFITDTHQQRLALQLSNINADYQLITL